MKNIINILVSIIFLISFIGVNINKHYANGELFSISVFLEPECGYSDMEDDEIATTCNHHEQEDCSCEDETETFKITNDFKTEKFSFPVASSLDLFVISIFHSVETPLFSTGINNTTYNTSLPVSGADIQAKFGVFLC